MKHLKLIKKIASILLIFIFVFSSIPLPVNSASAQLKAPAGGAESLGAGAKTEGESSALGIKSGGGTGLSTNNVNAENLGVGAAAGLASCGASAASAASAATTGGALGLGGSIVGGLRSAGSSIVSGITGIFGGASTAADAASGAGAAGGASGASVEFSGVDMSDLGASSVESFGGQAGEGTVGATTNSGGGGGGGGFGFGGSVWTFDLAANFTLTSISGTSGITSGNTTWQNQKDGFINCIFYNLSRVALQAIVASIISWANNGFQGNPSFIQNPTAFFTDIADQEIGRFIYGSGAYKWMCSPFSFQIRRAIIYNRSFAETSQCRLSQVVGNFNNFIGSANNELGTLGDWNSWNEISTNPSSNPYGTYALAEIQLEAKINGDLNQNQDLLEWANGFLSFRDPSCIAEKRANVAKYESPDYDPATDTIGSTDEGDCKIITPGTIIENTVGEAVITPLKELLDAKQINELVGALMVGLLKNIFSSGGLFGLGGGSDSYFNSYNGGQSYTAQLLAAEQTQFTSSKSGYLDQFTKVVQSENNYISVKNQTIPKIGVSVNNIKTLISCYSNSASSTVAVAPFTESDVAAASSTITGLFSLRALIERDVAIAEVNIDNMGRFYDTVSTLPFEQRDQLPNIVSQYTNISNSLHYESDVINAQYERDYTIPSTLDPVDQATNQKLLDCREKRSLPPSQNFNGDGSD